MTSARSLPARGSRGSPSPPTPTGARTALITTRGFRDVLELRRVRAPQIYDLFFEKPKILVPRRWRFELTERISAAGEVLIPLAEDELAALVGRLRSENIESVAVCF